MSEILNNNAMVDNEMQTEAPKKNSKKGSKKSILVDGKRVLFPEAKKEYLETYKSKPRYNEELYCSFCNCSFIRAADRDHQKSKKHIQYVKCYAEAKSEIENKSILNEDEKDEAINELYKIKRGQAIIYKIVKTYGKEYMDEFNYAIKSH